MESECGRAQQELQDSRDQNELLEFRILELEVSRKDVPGVPSRRVLKSCQVSHSAAQPTGPSVRLRTS